MRLPDALADRIELIPVGQFKTDDARPAFTLADPAAVIAASFAAAPGGRLLVDFDHRSVPVGDARPDTRAAGWITAMEVEGDRIMASVEWTPEGRAALEGRAYRFISPDFLTLPDRRVMRIDSAGLVNTPALPQLRQLASREDRMEPLDEIAGALGIAADKPADIVARVKALATSETQLASIMTAAGVTGGDVTRQICAKLAERAPDPTQFVSMKAHDAVVRQLASLQDAITKDRIDTAIEAGRAAGKITPANEDDFRQLASKDFDFFQRFVDRAPVLVNLGDRQLAGRLPPVKTAADGLDALERQIASRMGVSEADYLKQRAAMQEG